jgi:nitrate reductase gamma subunit
MEIACWNRDLHPTPLLINFNTFLPKGYVDTGGIVILSVVIFGIAFGILRWRRALAEGLPHITSYTLSAASKAKVLANSLGVDVLYQKPIADCSRTRWIAHLAMFWGFLGLAVTTTLDEILNPSAAPLQLTSPVRILGNVSGILFVAGVSYSLGRRLFVRSVRENSTRGDAVFLLMLFLTGVSGFTTEIFSDLNVVFPDGFSYWFHIILVAALLASAPFSKFVHAIGRPIRLLIKRSEIEKSKLADSKKLIRSADQKEEIN